jgi:hypothetical protein
MFLLLFCGALAAQIAIHFREQLRYVQTAPERIYGPPPRLLGWLRAPSLSPRQFALAGIILIVSLLGSAAGLAPRFFLALALVCHALYFTQIASLAYVQRKANLSLIVLLILLFAPALHQPLSQPAPAWPLLLVQLALAQMYFSAGWQKLRRAGGRWCGGRSLQAYLVEHYLWGDMNGALRLARSLRLCRILSALVLLFELTFILIVVFPAAVYVYALAGLAFHAGAAAAMRISYLKYLGPVYLVFATDPALRLWQALSA